VSLRWVYTQMIEKYARQNDHAGLLRQRVARRPGSWHPANSAERRDPGLPAKSRAQALALICAVKACQVSAGKASRGPSGCLLSRTATAGPTVPTSTQAPPLLPL
jgi:hypothetical protein